MIILLFETQWSCAPPTTHTHTPQLSNQQAKTKMDKNTNTGTTKDNSQFLFEKFAIFILNATNSTPK